MKNSKNLWKILGATFLGVSTLSVCAAAINNSLSKKQEETKAEVDYSTANSYHNAGNAWSLFTTLQSLTYTSTTKDYADLWTIYNSVFVKSDGYMKDYYSNSSTYKATTNQCGSYGGEGGTSGKTGCYNREHSIPKSWWGGSQTKQGADPYIVIPTDGYVNSMRSNLPMGKVASATYTSNNGYSKKGTADSTTFPGYTGTVFEPNDEVKGDFARLHFYAAVRYSSSTSGYVGYPTYNWTQADNGNSTFNGTEPTQSNSSDTSSRFCLTNYAIRLFTAWNKLDPPDAWEQSVNSSLSSIMGNVNPFIDHPEYADTLWGDVTGATSYSGGSSSTTPTITLSTSSLNLTVGGSTGTVTATLVNASGNVSWSISPSGYATISTSGNTCTVTPVAAGTATISASYSGATTKSCSVTVSESGSSGGSSSETISKATSISAGDSVILVSEDASNEMTSYSTSGTVYGIGTAYSGTPAGTMTFSVEAGSSSGTYAFINNSKYLNWSSGNSLSSATSKSANTSWNVSIDSSGNATITNASDNTRQIWWNVSSPRFACYTGKTAGDSYYNVQFYKVESSGGSTDPTLSGIAVKTAPTKTSYTSGEYFAPAGLKITASYSDSTTETITYSSSNASSFTFTPSTSTALTTSNTSVTISYGGKSTTQAITVSPASISASVSKTYYVGETISSSDISVVDNDGNSVSSFTFSNDGYQFIYSDAASGGSSTSKTFSNAITASGKTASLTVQVQRKAYETPTASVTDQITADDLNATGTTYTPFSNLSKTSNAKYSGSTAKDSSGNIQLRSKNSDAGIFSTQSGGTISSVKITIGTGTNTVNVYGKNTAYSEVSDLFDTSKQGTKIGSTSSTGTISVSGSYTFIGICSNSGACYISSIEITYGSGGGETATNVANYVMYEDTNNQCTTKFSVAKGYFEAMSSTERSTFMTSSDYVISTARERLQAWAKNQGQSITTSGGDYVIKTNSMFTPLSTNDTTTILLVVCVTSTLIGMTFIALSIKKRKEK